MFEEVTHKLLRQMIEEQRKSNCILRAMLKIQRPHNTRPDGGKITQINGGIAMAIRGTVPGTTSTFEIDALLNGAQDSAGWPAGTGPDVWTCDDPQAVVGPDSGPDANQPGALDQVTVFIPAGDLTGSMPSTSTPAPGTTGSYNLTASVQMPALNGVTPAPIVKTVNVPILGSSPVPVPSDGVINQIS